MVGLGLVSYGIYLWHQELIHEVRQWTRKSHRASVLNYALFTVMVTAPSVAVALISYVVVERPALRLKPRPTRIATAGGSAP